jgi:ATP-dependent protease ClpP protease subunit
MSKPPFKVVKNFATSTAEIFLYGIIGDFWDNNNPINARVIQQLLYSVSEYPRVNIHLNGPGGDTLEAFPMANLIKSFSVKQDIHTYNDGICASAMAIILLSVKRENRHGAKGSMPMIHAASTGNWGNSASMQDTKEMLDKYDETLAVFISDATGMPVADVVAKWLDGKDHWFTSAEAEAAELYTVEDYAAVPMPENVHEMKVDKVAAFYSQSKITNTDMDIFSTKFKTISALAKVAVADRTAEQFQAVKAELEAEGITGATLVPDVELKLKFDQADKVPALEGKVTDLGTQVTNLTTEKSTLAQKVTDLEAKVAEQAVELGKPAEEVKSPVTDKTDSTGDKLPVVLDFTTSVDEEYAKLWGK